MLRKEGSMDTLRLHLSDMLYGLLGVRGSAAMSARSVLCETEEFHINVNTTALQCRLDSSDVRPKKFRSMLGHCITMSASLV